jgi:hypothetical protein
MVVPVGWIRYASRVWTNPPPDDDQLLRATLDYATLCDTVSPSAEDHARVFAPFRDALHARFVLETSRGLPPDVARHRIVTAVRSAVSDTVSGPVTAHVEHAAQGILESAERALGPRATADRDRLAG